MDSTVKERIIQFIKHKKLSQAKFEKAIGAGNGFVNNISKGIGGDKLQSILCEFPELNTRWLMTGEGEMLRSGSVEKSESGVVVGKVIPLYDAEASAGPAGGMDMAPTYRPAAMIEIGSILQDSEMALRVYGNSMIPNYPAGCIVGLRLHRDSFIEPGRVYVIETAEDRYLKRVHYTKDKNALRCLSDNHMVYDDGPMKGEFCYPEFEIPFDEVKRLFRVVGVIKRNLM